MSHDAPAPSRRQFLTRTAATAAAAGSALALGGAPAALAAACGLTPPQTEGPFYPVPPLLFQPDKDRDLTTVRGRPGRALGEVIHVWGVVVDEACQPVANALVDIWQACASGRYHHPGDPNPAPLDPNFQYWGRALTDAQGRYSFRTILPGAYPATSGWWRPPHIHFKVILRGFHELTTQLYFDGQPLNAQDRILMALPPAERAKVVIKLATTSPQPTPQPLPPGSKVGRFDLVLKRVR